MNEEVPQPAVESSRKQVDMLREALSDRPRVLILTHDNPDPDAMAGALCLTQVVESFGSARPRIVYGGIVGRAENRHMVQALEIPLWSTESLKFRPDDVFIMVDTQPDFANNSLPDGGTVVAVVDHHEQLNELKAPVADVRPGYGAVTTIAAEYLLSSDAELTARLATAVCYAIGTETQDLGREASRADIAVFLRMFPLCDQPLLGRLRHPRHGLSFFADLDHAIRATEVVEDIAFCHMGRLGVPDAASEMADMLLTGQDINWVLCTGAYENQFLLSLRTSEPQGGAGELLRSVVGERSRAGGHDMMAGGAVDLGSDADVAEMERTVTERLLEALGRDTGAVLVPLLNQPGVGRNTEEGVQ